MNPKLIWGSLALLAIASLSLYLVFFRPATSEEHGHEHDEHEHADAHADHAHEKMVSLSEAQYRNAGIDTGWFEPKNLSEVIRVNGYTRIPPQHQAEVSLPLAGTIASILVIEGQYVKAGQALATVRSIAYNNLRLEREKLNEQLHQAEANLEFLKAEFARQKELSDEHVNARKVFQKVSADLNMEEARISSLKGQVAVLSQNIELGGGATSPTITLTAPISGSVTNVAVTIGAAVEPGKTLFSLADNSRMQVDLLVYEQDLLRVKPGQNVRFILANQGNTEISGSIFSIGKAFEGETKTVAVQASITGNPGSLIPGMYVNALIDAGMARVNALPAEAIVKAEGKEFIFLWEKENLTAKAGHPHEQEEAHDHDHAHEAGEDHDHAGEHAHEEEEPLISFARIEVKTGASQLGYVQVTPLAEIHAGDKIVTKGAYYLQSHLLKSEGGGGHDHAH